MKFINTATFITRYSLALAFLSAVADRFGLWGSPGSPNVVWGDYSKFLEYTAILNPLSSESVISLLGGIVTFIEILLSIFLMIGFRIKETAFFSASLLLIFAISMTFTVGIKVALDYSVFTAFSSALLLSSIYGYKERKK